MKIKLIYNEVHSLWHSWYVTNSYWVKNLSPGCSFKRNTRLTALLTCELQSHFPPQCPWSSWTCWGISYRSSVSGLHHHPGSQADLTNEDKFRGFIIRGWIYKASYTGKADNLQVSPLTMLGCQLSTFTQRSMHHQKSSSDSPFQANTENPTKETTTTTISEWWNQRIRWK